MAQNRETGHLQALAAPSWPSHDHLGPFDLALVPAVVQHSRLAEKRKLLSL